MPIEFHRDGPWELPESWVWARAGDLLPLEYGKGLPERIRDASGDIPVYGSAGVVGTHSEYLVESPCLVIARKGSVGAIYEETRPCWPIDTVYYAHDSAALCRRFAYWFFSFWRLDRLDQSTAVPSLSRDNYNGVLIPIAPLAEQRRIVARIDELFTEIADGETALNRARDDLDTWRRALLKAAVTGELTREWRETSNSNGTGSDVVEGAAELKAQFGVKSNRNRTALSVPNDLPDLPAIPSGWVWAKLSDFAWATSYGTSTKCAYDAAGIAVLRIPNIRSGKIALDDLKRAATMLDLADSDLLHIGDLLIVRTNGSEDLIGRAAIITEPLADKCYFASYLIRFRIVANLPLRKWISLFFETPIARAWIRRNIATSAGQYNISQSTLMQMPVPVPPETEMTVVLQIYEELASAREDAAIEAHEAYRCTSSARQAILKAAFEGNLIAQDSGDEPAEQLLERLGNQSGTEQPRRSGQKRRASLAAE